MQIFYSPYADIFGFTAQCKHSYNALYEGIYTVLRVVTGSFFLAQLHSLKMSTNTVMFFPGHILEGRVTISLYKNAFIVDHHQLLQCTCKILVHEVLQMCTQNVVSINFSMNTFVSNF